MTTSRRQALLLAAGALALAGCASAPPPTTAQLTYETAPEGATLFEGGQNIGTAPVTRTYTAKPGEATIRTPDVTAVWPSGAKASYYTLVPVGSDRAAKIERPAGAPGLQADLDNAKKFIAQREKDAQRLKEEALREQARQSGRCRAQQSSGGPKAGVDDCL